MTSITDPAFDRLPKWAQQEITTLRANVEHWKGRAVDLAGPTDTYFTPSADVVRWLPEGAMVRFGGSPDDRSHSIAVWRLATGLVRIETGWGGPLVVHPSASNSIHVEVGGR